ncbi:MAG: hypothetical protein EOO36_20940, partial [Cytophagaceae bacterium]
LITNPRVLAVNKSSTNNRQLFRRGDLVGWVADDPATGDKFLALFNAQDQELAPASEAALVSPPISREVSQAPLDVNITGAQKLYLMMRGGDDGTAWDHADWLNPVLVTNAGKTLDLTTLPWQNASAGWGKATVGKSVSGGPLLVRGQTYPTGIGTHANSIIEYTLPAGYNRFKATVGLDQAAAGQNTGGTFQALVFTKSPYQHAPADSVRVPVALADLGLAPGCTVHDLWSGRQVGKFTTGFAPFIRRHGAGFYRISGPKPAK